MTLGHIAGGVKCAVDREPARGRQAELHLVRAQRDTDRVSGFGGDQTSEHEGSRARG